MVRSPAVILKHERPYELITINIYVYIVGDFRSFVNPAHTFIRCIKLYVEWRGVFTKNVIGMV